MKHLFSLIACTLFAFNVHAQTITIGDYDELLASGTDDDTFSGSYFDTAPTTFYLCHTGSEIIYHKDELADAAGKKITSIAFIYNNIGIYTPLPREVKVYMKEVDDQQFNRNKDMDAYTFIEYMDEDTKQVASFTYDHDFGEDYGANGELVIDLDTPYEYSGEKNLLVILTFDGNVADDANGSLDITFFCNKDLKKRCLTYVSDKFSFDEFADTEDWPKAGATIQCGTNIELPVTKLTYEDSEATAISNVNAADNSNKTYNIAGQRIANTHSGSLYINNGKTFIKK